MNEMPPWAAQDLYERGTRFIGHTNYETWAVCFWLRHDPQLNVGARQVVLAAGRSNPTDSPINVSVVLEGWVREMQPGLGASLWADLLDEALSRVNWFEVAKSRLEE